MSMSGPGENILNPREALQAALEQAVIKFPNLKKYTLVSGDVIEIDWTHEEGAENEEQETYKLVQEIENALDVDGYRLEYQDGGFHNNGDQPNVGGNIYKVVKKVS